MKFEVLLESLTARRQVSIDADSHEEAVAKAAAMKLTETVELRLVWVDTSVNVQACGRLGHEVIGYCDGCAKPIVDRDIQGQPWNYTTSDHGGLLCYACAGGVPRE